MAKTFARLGGLRHRPLPRNRNRESGPLPRSHNETRNRCHEIADAKRKPPGKICGLTAATNTQQNSRPLPRTRFRNRRIGRRASVAPAPSTPRGRPAKALGVTAPDQRRHQSLTARRPNAKSRAPYSVFFRRGGSADSRASSGRPPGARPRAAAAGRAKQNRKNDKDCGGHIRELSFFFSLFPMGAQTPQMSPLTGAGDALSLTALDTFRLTGTKEKFCFTKRKKTPLKKTEKRQEETTRKSA